MHVLFELQYEMTVVLDLLLKGHPRAAEKLARGIRGIQVIVHTRHTDMRCYSINLMISLQALCYVPGLHHVSG